MWLRFTFSVNLQDDHAFEVRHSLLMTAAVSSSCAAMSSPSILKKLLSCATGVRLRVTVRVRIRVRVSLSI